MMADRLILAQTGRWVKVIDRPRKEQVACCTAQRDDQGRLPIGFCGPDCERRP